MLGSLAKRIFGSSNDRFVKRMDERVQAVNALEPQISALSDEALTAKTAEFRARLADGATLDDLLPEAFAVTREAAKRVLGQRHYDVQLKGGIVLHQGKITEMKTGEGKTLVATLAAYLNALPGKGVHVVTVNDYLAQRDSEWMGRVYRFLGLTCDCIVHGLDDNERRAAYAADITYATNNELGFDYLRDNMKYQFSDMVQRPFQFAIVDEVDSILVDEARTPLIISGPTEDKSEMYIKIDAIMRNVTAEYFDKDEKARSVTLNEAGNIHVEQLLRDAGLLVGEELYDFENVSAVHHLQQALKAHQLFTRDVDYIVKDGKVVIIDEFTGRMMEGRRYSDGLHQALEAKEHVQIQNENQTLASITFQNYFRLYPKLAGMTGTAATEASEFEDIYKLQVIEMPTNVPVARLDEHDEVYRTAAEKNNAIVAEIEAARAKNQPVLVGTVSIEKSELLSELLKKKGIQHQVLNARYHEQEAYIIAQAGRSGAVTIATNMAGRGTDIQLGGNAQMRVDELTRGIDDPELKKAKEEEIRAEVETDRQKVLAAGGLYVMGTERHESRRIDNQLRGRSGRQGDPGRSKFYISLDDDLMRIFGSERMNSMLVKLGIEEGEAIIHPWINRAIEKAQERVEARNYDTRKNLLKYDDVMNDQRKVIYEQRIDLLQADDVTETIAHMRSEVIADLVSRCIPPKSYSEQWLVEDLAAEMADIFGLDLPIAAWAAEEGMSESDLEQRLQDAANSFMAARAADVGPDFMRVIERNVLLQTLDREWKEHLAHLDHLRNVIGLRAYAQRDPLNEYKTEAFAMFESMLAAVRNQVTRALAHVQVQMEAAEPQAPQEFQAIHQNPITGENEMADLPGAGAFATKQPFDENNPATWARTPRNAPCPCGSGKKYKHCHGSVAGAAE